ncbi:hypothetical protein KTD28_06060 [Burkholderia gladioli]|uniref:hypothetical protein n=1 Tax=Burkholderia gladioli TaxID=28095 RepID=UPI001ABB70ED|nr:hypothetical protein [Burkholderia gladioli]MBU9154171.1 hypothetical protein [Burkholderia gladioli]
MTNNTTAPALTDDEREKLIDLVDRLIRNPDAVSAKDCIIGNDVRTVQWIAEHTRALLTSPRAAVPAPKGWKLVPIERSYNMRAKALIAFNTTEKKTNDRDDALDAAHRAMLDAAPAAPAAPVAADEAATFEQWFSSLSPQRRALIGDVRDARMGFEAARAAVSPATATFETVTMPHKWDETGERCVRCGDKDWMGTTCTTMKMQAPATADERADWSATRHSLAIAIAAFGTRPDGRRGTDAAAQMLESITEPGSPLSWLRASQAAAPARIEALRKGLFNARDSLRAIYENRVTSNATIRHWIEDANRVLNGEQAAAPADAREPDAYILPYDLEVLKTYSAQCQVTLYREPRKTRVPLYAGCAPADAGEAVAADQRDVIQALQKALAYWMPNVFNDRSAQDAYLLVGYQGDAVEESWGERMWTEMKRLTAIINTPQSGDFLRAVSIEAEHQRQHRGEHDADKTPADWFWLVGYLAGKALHAHAAGNVEKAEHHVITTAAALANWHLAIFGKTDMRPGTEQPDAQGAQGGKGGEA